jgi:hypothetical protein
VHHISQCAICALGVPWSRVGTVFRNVLMESPVPDAAALASIPSVDRLLRHDTAQRLIRQAGRAAVTEAIRRRRAPLCERCSPDGYRPAHEPRTRTIAPGGCAEVAGDRMCRFVQHILPRLRADPAVGVSCQHLSQRPHGARTDATRHTISGGRSHGRANHADDRHADRRLVGVSLMRRADDRRPDPLGTPLGHPHTGLRHVMSATRLRRDRRTSSAWSLTCQGSCIRRRVERRKRRGREIRFQLHSRPPRQRLPSSLVIESASASASRCVSNNARRGTSDER